MGQTEAAASIEVVNRGVSLSIAQAAHEDLPFSVGDTDRRLLLGGCGNVIDEAIKLEAAHLVKLVGPTVGGACDGERVGFAKEVDTANVIEVEALGRRTIFGTTSIRTCAEAMPKGSSVKANAMKVFFIIVTLKLIFLFLS